MNQAPTPLEAIIFERLRAAGALTFADYMDLALYHPQFGYYTSGGTAVGWGGDFFTSPHLHPLFGLCLARQIVLFWEALRQPRPLVVEEHGAGTGVLARHIQAALQARWPELAEALDYRTVEVGPAPSATSVAATGLRPASAPPSATSVAATGLRPDGAHIIFSNELLDALPVHVVEARGGHLLEVYVQAQGMRLAEVLGEPSSEALVEYLDRFRVPWRGFADGWRAEISLRALDWLRQTAARLQRGGYLLTIDYGDVARRLYSRLHPRGTLLCYFRHTANEQPLLRPGQQDITAHVNVTALIEEGRRVGLSRVELTTQRVFLLGLGMREELEALRISQFAAADTARQSDQGQTALLRFSSLRNAVAGLLDPAGLGGFRVLAQRKRRR